MYLLFSDDISMRMPPADFSAPSCNSVNDLAFSTLFFMALVNVNAARLIEEKDLEEKFEGVFSEIITNEKLQKEMQKQLKSIAKPQATQHIINEMKQLI